VILIVRLAQHGLFFAAEAVFCRYTAVKRGVAALLFCRCFLPEPGNFAAIYGLFTGLQ
jgi:hypothetical protein